jgi:hypothetical protein
MDNVLYALKNKALGHDMDYGVLDIIIGKFLKQSKVKRTEYFFVEMYCRHYLGTKLKKLRIKTRKKSRLLHRIIDKFKNGRQKRLDNEAYLKTSFEEDMRCSLGEIQLLI